MKWPRADGAGTAAGELPNVPAEIAQLARSAQMEIEAAHSEFGEVSDGYLVDHAIYRLRAAERHYAYILGLARAAASQRKEDRIEWTRW